MPTIPIHPPNPTRSAEHPSPLPQLLHTPAGLAILELQGTINLPSPPTSSLLRDMPSASALSSTPTAIPATPVGRLHFPDYDPTHPTDTKWMKRVYLFVGRHQRLTGEVKALGRAVAILRKGGQGAEGGESLEICEIVRWKVVFSSRPEPVGGVGDGE